MEEYKNELTKHHAHFIKCMKSATAISDRWASLLDSCFQYAIPFRNRFYRSNTDQGELKNIKLYDTTAVDATKIFVSKMHEALTPPQSQWGYLELNERFEQMIRSKYGDSDQEQEEAENEIIDAQNMLDDYMKNVFNHIHESNFDPTVNESYFDVAVGTSAMIVNQGFDYEPLIFTSVPVNELSIKAALNGRIESWFRKWEDVKINEINLVWPRAKLTAQMKSDLIGNHEAKVKILHEGVYYLPGEPLPYLYGVSNGEEFIFHEYLESNPGIVWRFQKINSETWGRGPVMDALPSMASLNEMARISMASASLNVFRPYLAWSDGVFNPNMVKLEPFSVISIAPVMSGGMPPLQPLPNSASPDFGQLLINDLRMQIRSLLFNETPDTASIQPESASKTIANRESLARKIGPIFSRLQQEFLWPVIKRCMYILDKMGIVPRPKIDSKYIKFAYRSPLAAEKGLEEMMKFFQFTEMNQKLNGPELAKLYINGRKAVYKLAQYMQIDPDLLNHPQKVAESAQQLADIMQQQADMARQQGSQPPPMVGQG